LIKHVNTVLFETFVVQRRLNALCYVATAHARLWHAER